MKRIPWWAWFLLGFTTGVIAGFIALWWLFMFWLERETIGR